MKTQNIEESRMKLRRSKRISKLSNVQSPKLVNLEEEGYWTLPQTLSPTRKTTNIDIVQQEIYNYVESLEQRTQQKVNFSFENQENAFNVTPLSYHTPEGLIMII